MAFRGWPAEAIEFYEGLCADNSKTYWTAHKETYDEAVRAPMVELLAELEPEFGAAKIFRPNRDVRFSKDKSPYKTQIAATLERGGYVKFAADGLGVGAGAYLMDSPSLQRFRAAVADDKTGPALVGIVATLRKAGVGVSTHESLKRVPPGFPPDHPRADLLKRKGVGISFPKIPKAVRFSPKLRDWLAARSAETAPLIGWIEEHLS